jgi:hypothetical protein
MKKPTTSRDTGLAGRPRFYKQVNITTLGAAPWEEIETVINKSSKFSSSNDKETVNSPTLVGVDGSQSATGVHHPHEQSDTSYFEWMLTPRCHGKTSPTSTSSSPSWYGVILDGRTLKTPMGQTLSVPSSL